MNPASSDRDAEAALTTEQRNDASAGLDRMTPLEILTLMNREDRRAVDALHPVLPDLAALVEIAADRVTAGGTVHYFGAGTSGRLGVLDAAELLPTFNLEPGVVVAHLAGGGEAMVRAVENSEDSWQDGAAEAAGLGRLDVAIGLTASGRTPYVGGALDQAARAGAYTVLVACNPAPQLAGLADLTIAVDTGPEVLTGSTRLKAGTVEKLVLNGFSTALMVRLGRTWSNLMVSVVATNAKLRRRTVRILAEALTVSEEDSLRLLGEADGELKTALVAGFAGVPPELARAALAESDGSVRGALAALSAT